MWALFINTALQVTESVSNQCSSIDFRTSLFWPNPCALTVLGRWQNDSFGWHALLEKTYSQQWQIISRMVNRLQAHYRSEQSEILTVPPTHRPSLSDAEESFDLLPLTVTSIQMLLRLEPGNTDHYFKQRPLYTEMFCPERARWSNTLCGSPSPESPLRKQVVYLLSPKANSWINHLNIKSCA